MATKYVIWERASMTFVGGAKPVTFDVSADASAQAASMLNQSNRAADTHRKPLPTFDVITVTV